MAFLPWLYTPLVSCWEEESSENEGWDKPGSLNHFIQSPFSALFLLNAFHACGYLQFLILCKVSGIKSSGFLYQSQSSQEMIIYTSGLLLGGGVTRKWRMGQVWESKPFYTISIFSSISPQCLLCMWLSPIPDSLQSFRDKIIWFLVSVTIQSRNRNHIRSVNRDKK